MSHDKQTGWLDAKQVKLTIITPTSISSNEVLTPISYIYNLRTDEVFYLRMSEWVKFLNRKRLLADYELLLREYPKNIVLYSWLKGKIGDHAITTANLGSAVAVKSIMQRRNLRTATQNSLNNIKPQMRLIDGRVYIPGSSIKGMIRQALLFYLLQQNPNIKNLYWEKVKTVAKNYNNRNLSGTLKGNIGKLNSEIAQALLFKLKKGEKKGVQEVDSRSIFRSGGLADVLTGLRCSDALPVGDIKTEILQKVDLTLKADHKQNYISVFRESILPGSQFTFSLSIDKYMLECIGIHSVEQLQACIENYYTFLNTVQLRPFRALHKEVLTSIAGANTYLGGNLGFNYKTLLMALAPTPEEGTSIIKILLDNSFKKRKQHMREPFSPRTLKATKYNGEIVLTGGVRLTIEE